MLVTLHHVVALTSRVVTSLLHA